MRMGLGTLYHNSRKRTRLSGSGNNGKIGFNLRFLVSGLKGDHYTVQIQSNEYLRYDMVMREKGLCKKSYWPHRTRDLYRGGKEGPHENLTNRKTRHWTEGIIGRGNGRYPTCLQRSCPIPNIPALCRRSTPTSMVTVKPMSVKKPTMM
jgi:hypothetical protein